MATARRMPNSELHASRRERAHAPPPAPSRTEALEAAWREFHRTAAQAPAAPGGARLPACGLTEAFARIVPADAAVLEVGCGEGDLLAALPNARRMGIDYLPEVVARARPATPTSRSRSATRPRGRRRGRRQRVADPVALGTWDAVVCDRLCHSVLDVKALLTGLKRQLAPGGRVYMTVFNYLWELPVRLAEMAGWKNPAPTANWLSDSDLRNLFDITGLEVVRYEDRLMLPLEVPGVSSGAEPIPGARAGR